MPATESAIASLTLWPAEPPALRPLDPPAILTVPLAAHSSAAVRPKPPGTRVAPGDSLVESTVESTHVALAPVHGSISSPIQVTLTNGQSVPGVQLLVRPDSPSPDCTDQPLSQTPQEISPNSGGGPALLVQWIQRLRNAGVFADRHSSPDLISQLNHIVKHPIEIVLCSTLDTDPGARLNSTLAAQHSAELVGAVKLLARLTAARTAMIVIETSAPPGWIMPLRSAAQAAEIQIVDLHNDYPQSDPTLMLYSVADRRLRPGQLPVTQKVLLLDAAAALTVHAGATGTPTLHTPLAIRDHVHRKTHFLSVAVGTPLRHILQRLRIPTEQVMLRGGDLLRDIRLTLDSVVAGGELVIHVTPPEIDLNPEPCIRCGWCIQTCPTRVQPASLLDAAQRDDSRLAERAGIHACLECGLCSHVCPSHLPLAAAIRKLKSKK